MRSIVRSRRSRWIIFTLLSVPTKNANMSSLRLASVTHDIYHSIGNDVMDMMVQTASRNSHYYTSYTPASADMSIGHTSPAWFSTSHQGFTLVYLCHVSPPLLQNSMFVIVFPRRRYLFAFPVDLGVRYLLPFCRVLVIPGSPTTSRILTHCLRQGS